MAENGKNSGLKIYIGENEAFQDVLCLDLIIPGREIPLYMSDSLDDCSGGDFLSYLEKAFNEARLFARNLSLRISVEMGEILSLIEDLEESDARNAKLLIKEMEEE